MAKKKRMTRKELLKEPDKILTFSTKAALYATQHQNQVIYGAAAVLAVILLFFLFQHMSAQSEQKAFGMFQEAMSGYMAQTSAQPSTPGADSDAAAKFDELLTQYGSSDAAHLALPMYADLMYRQGDYDKAIELYHRALKAFSGRASFEQIIWNGLGYAYEGKKDYASAAQWFEKVADSQDGVLKADAYFNLGRMYEALGQKEKAVAAYSKVAEDFGQSMHAKLAEAKIAQLKS